jgi:kynureninase
VTVLRADQLDADDPLAGFRQEFELPTGIYLVGNSLGALPRTARSYLNTELDRWSTLGAEGHFTGNLAWRDYHELLTDQLATLVGARPVEVVAMNALTVNLHLLMVSFYQPRADRHKILIEDHAFPSDHFAVESQIRQRGYDPAQSLITIGPRPGEETLREEDILAAIAEHGDSLAMVLLPGVQYFTGQVLPMRAITDAGHAVGAVVGFDLAHAVGNIPLELHEWGVDFAAWCTYKYLNSGPGSVGAAYVHERHVADPDLPRFLGWWGTATATRFKMDTTFEPIPTVEAWQVSNAPVLPMAVLRASLDLFEAAGGMVPLRAKSEKQIAFLDHLLAQRLGSRITSITPTAAAERGCQVALRVTAGDGRRVFRELQNANVHCDWREPDVIRAAPVPLYNTFADIEQFIDILDEVTQ